MFACGAASFEGDVSIGASILASKLNKNFTDFLF
jgi:hypothetical protein